MFHKVGERKPPNTPREPQQCGFLIYGGAGATEPGISRDEQAAEESALAKAYESMKAKQPDTLFS